MAKNRLGKSSLFPTSAPPPARSQKPAQTRRPAFPAGDSATHQEQPDPTPNAPAPVPAASEPAPAPAGVGRPRKHTEPWKKVTALLLSRNVLFLDGLSLDIAKRTGASIARAEILRGMIEAVEESGVDLAGVTTEEELKTILLDRLRG